MTIKSEHLVEVANVGPLCGKRNVASSNLDIGIIGFFCIYPYRYKYTGPNIEHRTSVDLYNNKWAYIFI